MVEAFIGSGIDADGLIEAYIVLDDLALGAGGEVGVVVLYLLGGLTIGSRHYIPQIVKLICLAIEIVLGAEIALLPIFLLICDADFALIDIGGALTVFHRHQFFISVLAKQQFPCFGHVYDCIIVLRHKRIRIRILLIRIHFCNLIGRICPWPVSPHFRIDGTVRICWRIVNNRNRRN